MNVPLSPNIMSSSKSSSQQERRVAAELRLEQMLAKAELLANEIREAAHSSSASQPKARRSLSSQQRDSHRSLPQMIDLSPPDDTARSECSSLGLSLASAMMVPKLSSSSTPSPMENMGSEQRDIVLLVQQNETMCGVIREGSIYDASDEKKSCDDSTNKEAGKLRLVPAVGTELVHDENVLNAKPVLTVSTPPKMKRTSDMPAEASSTIRTVSEGVMKASELPLSKPVLQEVPSHSKKTRSWEPRSTIVSEQDDDYVPIKDYSVPTHREVANVKWEKVDTANVGDDDYVPLQDYSQFTKLRPRGMNEELEGSLSYASRRTLWLRRRRKQRRRQRLFLLLMVVLSILGYFAYLRYKDWAKERDVQQPDAEYASIVELDREAVDTTVVSTLDHFVNDSLDSDILLEEEKDERNDTDWMEVPLGNETLAPLELELLRRHVGWNMLLVHFPVVADKAERRRWVEDLVDGMLQ